MSCRWTCRLAGRAGDRPVPGRKTLASNGSKDVDLACGKAVYELVRASLIGGDGADGGGMKASKVVDIEMSMGYRQVSVHDRLVLHNMVILERAVELGSVRRHCMGLS